VLAEERRLQLAEWTREDGRLDANVAATKLDVAVETVRRDLDVLQRRGALRRVHGGAIALEKFAYEYTIPERYNRNPQQKQSVADVAAAYIPEQGCIFVDGGTTTECLEQHLRDKPKLMVVTNHITLASKLADSTTQVTILGGRIRPATLSAVGAKTVADLQDFNAVASFIGVNGIGLEGGMTAYDTDEALVKKTISIDLSQTLTPTRNTSRRSVMQELKLLLRNRFPRFIAETVGKGRHCNEGGSHSEPPKQRHPMNTTP